MKQRMLEKKFFEICEKIQTGQLNVTVPGGRSYVFGTGQPHAHLHIRDWKMMLAILLKGDVGLGESYTDGLWDSDNIETLVLLALVNDNISAGLERGSFLQRMVFMFKDRIVRKNSIEGSRKNIRAHYDVGNDFYQLWLDETMSYSSGLYISGEEDIVTAQHQKYDRLLGMLDVSSERVLEVGCGWGGLAERAADQGRHVTGITISKAQHDYAAKRLGSKANIVLSDYRMVKDKYDAIVSIEMLEAVGIQYWPEYFRTLKSRLNDGGKIALQTIIMEDAFFDRYKNQSDYIRQYTFPGGMLINPASIKRHAENAGLKVNGLHRFGLDYAKTLRVWAQNFYAAEDKIRALGHDNAFMRSWTFYLHFCAAIFASDNRTNVAQLELSHS